MEEFMNVSTEKVRAICREAGVDNIDDVPEAIKTLRGFAQGVWRHIKGAVMAIPISDEEIDATIAALMRKAGRNRL